MAEDFRLQEECQALQDVSNYPISNEHDIRSMDSGEVSALLEGTLLAPQLLQGLTNLTQMLSSR